MSYGRCIIKYYFKIDLHFYSDEMNRPLSAVLAISTEWAFEHDQFLLLLIIIIPWINYTDRPSPKLSKPCTLGARQWIDILYLSKYIQTSKSHTNIRIH